MQLFLVTDYSGRPKKICSSREKAVDFVMEQFKLHEETHETNFWREDGLDYYIDRYTLDGEKNYG